MNTKSFTKLTASAVVAGFMAFAAPAQATVIGITSLTGTDSFNWGQLGTAPQVLIAPLNVTSTGGNTGVFNELNGDTAELFQNGTNAPWYGNFAPGANVMWNQGNGPDVFTLTNPVGSIGAQIQQNSYGAFTAEIIGYNSLNQVVGTFTENGTSNGNNDNSAIFIGLSDTVAEITKVQFELTNGNNDFAIGSIQTSGAVSSVPLPAGMPMFVFALLSVFGAVQFSKKRNFA